MAMSFKDLLNEYLFVGPKKPRYWQDYKDRMWLEKGIRIRAGDGTRERVLEEYRKERKRQGEAMFKELIVGDSWIMKAIAKDDCWTGGNLVVPFGSKVHVSEPVFFNKPNPPSFPWVKT